MHTLSGTNYKLQLKVAWSGHGASLGPFQAVIFQALPGVKPHYKLVNVSFVEGTDAYLGWSQGWQV